jgi:hypothetical protein
MDNVQNCNNDIQNVNWRRKKEYHINYKDMDGIWVLQRVWRCVRVRTGSGDGALLAKQ